MFSPSFPCLPGRAHSLFLYICFTCASRIFPLVRALFRARPCLYGRYDTIRVELVQAKVEAEGTALYRETAELCSRGLLEEYFRYIERTRTLLKSLPSGSKLYWKVSKRLLMRPESCSTLPTLRDNDGWARTSQEKSNVLANAFSGKWILPPVANNEYSDILVANDHASSSQSGFLLLRTRVLKRLLKALAVDSATGPDLISSRLLKFCADSLALPFCKLARCIVRYGIWPASWCFHWICALHKKKSPSDPNNYRGLQLTSQLSKVMERFIGLLFQPFLETSLAFGENQFAYCKGKGSRDAILFLILNWLLALAGGNKIAVYCSDVSFFLSFQPIYSHKVHRDSVLM